MSQTLYKVIVAVLVFHKKQRDENSFQIYQVCRKLWQCAQSKLCAFLAI